ncbi:MAG TPA: glycerophosphodiester phosphodiesterase [Gemmatimonadaceae bacterium]|nr:glycerophosphodiester phosphodiesterase [Gemmatimonadaceae bacterium]
MAPPPLATSRPHVERIGHRGAPREYPENTLPAFARAVERGADGIELDVHVTTDGVPVVHHDPQVRVDKGRAPSRALAQMSWEEVARVELAPGITIPSLEQVLTAVGNHAIVYVELKGKNSAEATLELIARSRARCAVHSFDHAAVSQAARLAPAVRRGILFDAYPEDIDGAMREAAALDVWPEWKLIDAPLVERVHARGGRVIAWTVNTTAAADELIRLGVDGLCGDDVRLLPK